MDPKKGKDVPDDAAAESTFSEYLRRCRDGESLSFEDFCAEHAEIEDALRILHARHVGEDTVAHDVDPSKLPIADELLEGERRLGDYRIIREIGRGGMGTVFEAIQESLGRRVALKILPGNFALDPKRVERFHREARSTAKIHHANIVPVYDVGEADGNHFYSMEFIDGPSLHQVISEARASAGKTEGSKKDSSTSDPAYISNAVERMAELAEGLEEAHKLGLIHRDVKPSNILVDKSGRWVLVDFGLVHEEAAQTITQSGEMLGTLSYMSPEQVAPGRKRSMHGLTCTAWEQRYSKL